MTSDRIRAMRLSTAAAVAVILSLSLSAFAQSAPSKAVVSQIATIQQVKQNFTPVQKKMDSNLAFAIVGQNAAGNSFASAMSALPTTPNGRIIVDVYGTVSPALAQAIRNAGGHILYQSVRWSSSSCRPAAGSSIESVAAACSDVTRVAKAAGPHQRWFSDQSGLCRPPRQTGRNRRDARALASTSAYFPTARCLPKSPP